MPAGAIIGRVSVKVLPDTSDFRRDVKAKLGAIEKSLKLQVATGLDITGAKRDLITAVREINAENRSMSSRKIKFFAKLDSEGMRGELARYRREATAMAKTNPIKIKTDLVAAQAKLDLDKSSLEFVKAQLDHWKRSNSPIKIEVKPEMALGATTLVAARMDIACRPRRIKILPYLDKTAMGKIASEMGTLLAALSGARMLSSTFSNIKDMFKNLDKIVPLIAVIGNAIGLLGISALTSSSNIFALALSLASIAGAGLALPGIFGGIVTGLGLTMLAMKGIKTYMPDLYREWTSFKDLATKDFWSTASTGIHQLATLYLPELGNTAKKLGTFWGGLAAAISKPFKSALGTMFTDLNKSIAISTSGTGIFADVLTRLGLTGSAYLPSLATWFNHISTTFDNFLKRASTDGTLKAWIDGGITALHDLGGVLKGTLNVLGDLGRAAQAAGGSTLGILADSLDRLHKVTSGVNFQTGMANAFRSAHQAISLIVEKSGPAVSNFFTVLSRTLTTLLPIIGSTLGTAFAALANAMSQPAFQGGLVAMFDGIRKGVEGLAPALPAIGQAFGALGGIIGTMATTFGPLLAGALQVICDIFQALRPAIEPLIPILGNALLTIIQAIAPALVAVATALAPVISALGTALADAVTTLAPSLTMIADALGQALVQALTMLTPYIGPLTKALTDTLVAILPLVPQILDLATALLPLVDLVLRLAVSVLPLLTAATQVQIDIFSGLIGAVRWLLDVFNTCVGGLLRGAATVAEGLHLPFADGLRKASDEFDAMVAKSKVSLDTIPPMATTAGAATGANFGLGLASGQPAVVAAAQTTANNVVTSLNIPGAPLGLGVATSYATGLTAQQPVVNAVAATMGSGVRNLLNVNALPVGNGVGLTYGQGLLGQQIPVTSDALLLATGVKSSLALPGFPIGSQVGVTYGSGLSAQGPVVNAVAATMGSNVRNYLNIPAVPLGYGVGIRYGTGLASALPNAKGAANGVATAVYNSLHGVPAGPAGYTVATTYGSGISTGGPRVISVVSGIHQGVAAALSFSAYPIGVAVVAGFASGIAANTALAAMAAASVAGAAQAAMRKNLQVNSPSKVTRRIGLSVGEGFAQGIQRNTKLVVSAATSLADTAQAAISKSISKTAIQVPVPELAGAGTKGVSRALNAAYGAAGNTPGSQGNVSITVPMMPTNSTPEDVADALLFAVRRMSNGGVYAQG